MLYPLARHFLFKLNPEQAHDLSIKYLPHFSVHRSIVSSHIHFAPTPRHLHGA